MALARGAYRARLWESKKFSDVVVVFSTKANAAREAVQAHMKAHSQAQNVTPRPAKQHKGPGKAKDRAELEQEQQTPVSLEPTWPDACQAFQVHAAVLGEESQFFAQALTGDSPLFASDQELRMHTPQGEKHVLIVGLEPEHLQLAEPLLRRMYTGELDAGVKADTEQLLQMWLLAEQVQVQSAKSTCAEALLAIPEDQLSIHLSGQVLTLLTSTTMGDSPELKQLQARCEGRVVTMFKDVVELTDDPVQLASFCGLPFAAVKAWAASDALQVDSENLVLWMLHQWHKAQLVDAPGNLSAQMTQLAALVRVSQLSPTYLLAALQLGWFQPRERLLSMAGAITSGALKKLPVSEVNDAKWPAAWVMATGRVVVQPKLLLDMDVAAQQLQEGLKTAGERPSKALRVHESPWRAIKGFKFALQLEVQRMELDKYKVGLFVKSEAMVPFEALPASDFAVTADVKLCARMSSTRDAAVYSYQCQGGTLVLDAPGRGFSDFFNKLITTAADLSEFLVDGKLQVRAILSMVDGQA